MTCVFQLTSHTKKSFLLFKRLANIFILVKLKIWAGLVIATTFLLKKKKNKCFAVIDLPIFTFHFPPPPSWTGQLNPPLLETCIAVLGGGASAPLPPPPQTTRPRTTHDYPSMYKEKKEGRKKKSPHAYKEILLSSMSYKRRNSYPLPLHCPVVV